MLQWLNTNLGTDWATYLSLVLAVVALVAGGTIYKIRKQKNINIHQTAKDVQGDAVFIGRDQTIHNHHYEGLDSKHEDEKKKNEHDLKIIEDILTLLPYENTVYQLEQSYIAGILFKFSQNLEEAQKFADVNYSLFNMTTNDAKNIFIDSIKKFNEITMNFLTIDHPDREPLKLDLPYDWRDGGKNEERYRSYQSQMREASGEVISRYREFIRIFKSEGFVTGKRRNDIQRALQQSEKIQDCTSRIISLEIDAQLIQKKIIKYINGSNSFYSLYLKGELSEEVINETNIVQNSLEQFEKKLLETRSALYSLELIALPEEQVKFELLREAYRAYSDYFDICMAFFDKNRYIDAATMCMDFNCRDNYGFEKLRGAIHSFRQKMSQALS